MKKSKLVVTLSMALLATFPTEFFGRSDGPTLSPSAAPSAPAVTSAPKAKAHQDDGVLGVNFFEVEPVLLPDYVCPTCGAHRSQGYARYVPVAVRKSLPPDIEECRRLFARVPPVAALKLDEREYCLKCSPDIRKPSLSLVVPRATGEPRRIRHVTAGDLSLLGDYYEASRERQTEMRRSSRRLRKLLGL